MSKGVTGKLMATNSNQPLSSAALEANARKQKKGVIGPGESVQNVKGKVLLLSDSNNSEQVGNSGEKYLTSRALKGMSAEEEDAFISEAQDAQDLLTERVDKIINANLQVANVAVVDVSMGEARVEACKNLRPDPPMTMPQGHEQELMPGGGEIVVSSDDAEVVMSEGHVVVDGIPLSPMTSPQGRDQEVKVDALVDLGSASSLPQGQSPMQEALGVRMRPVAKDQLPDEWKNRIQGGGAGAGGIVRLG